MVDNRKRKNETGHGGHTAKKSKPWMVPKKGQPGYVAPSIEPGDAGIWATCVLNKEGQCQAQLLDLFEEYAKKLYDLRPPDNGTVDPEDAEADIEAEISKEVQGLKSVPAKRETLFQPVKMDIPCVLFFKTRAPIEPVHFVHSICKDASMGAAIKCQFIKKLTPMSMMGKASPEGLEKVASTVLQPTFHAEGTAPVKYAIRPTRRNNNIMHRDGTIKQIANAVGRKHSVDLKNYDYLILVDIYRNILGMSIVGSDFEELKQYNLAEILDPKPKPDTGGKSESIETLVDKPIAESSKVQSDANQMTSNHSPDEGAEDAPIPTG